MIPSFQITADNVDITAIIKQRLISIKTTDKAGFESDTCTIELDDRDEKIATPKLGAKLIVSLGYEHTALTQIGIYTVDEVALSGFPQTLIISAKAADMGAELKAEKTRSFDSITLGKLADTVAAEHGLIAKVSPSLSNIKLGNLNQTEESNLHLMTRLANQHNTTSKVTHQHLIVAKSGESKTSKGVSLSTIQVAKKQLTSYYFTAADRSKYAAVTAHWHDKKTAKDIAVSTSKEKPAHTLRHTYDNQQQALEAANAKFTKLQQGTTTLELGLDAGNPTLFAESPLKVSGLRADISNPIWTAISVTHNFSPAGFTTTINSEIKK